jgi:hypothetical protein
MLCEKGEILYSLVWFNVTGIIADARFIVISIIAFVIVL